MAGRRLTREAASRRPTRWSTVGDDRPIGSGEDQTGVFGTVYAETGLVEHAVMASAQQHQVAELGGSPVYTVDQVVDVTEGRAAVTTRP